MRKALELCVLLLSAVQLAGHSPALAGGRKPKCGEILTVSTKEDLAKLSPSDIDQYFKFIKSKLRLPTPQETKNLALARIPLKFVFGAWGDSIQKSSDASLKAGQLQGSAKANHSIFSSDQIEALMDVFYKKLKENVRETNVYPPSFNDLALYLGFRGNEIKAFKHLFDEKNGLFLGYNQGFKSNALRWKNFADFFNAYPDQTVFTPANQAALTEDIRNTPALLIAGYVSGHPLPPNMIAALENLQNNSAKLYDARPSLITAPAYGIASGLPPELHDPAEQRYVCPQSIFLQESFGNETTINEIALPNRALNPKQGLLRVMKPGKQMLIVHPYQSMDPFPSGTEYPGAVIATGSITEPGHNEANRPIGARISGILNEEQTRSGVVVLEKLTGTKEEAVHGLEANFRPRGIPYSHKEVTVDFGKGRRAAYPPGFADLNKLFGNNGEVYDLPLFITLGDSHFPLHDRGVFENLYRQFIDPKTCLKRSDGKPVDIVGIAFNDHFNGDWFSSYTDKDNKAKASLVKDPLESNLDLHLRNGVDLQKDLQQAIFKTRGYVPNVYYMLSNHDSERLEAKLRNGTYLTDPINKDAYIRLEAFRREGKNPFRAYLTEYIGVGYNDHVRVLAPGEKFSMFNAVISHGHQGGVYGKPVSSATRRAAQGAAITGHTHIAMQSNEVLNAGHTALPFGYAEGWFNQGYQGIVISSPLHAQVLFYKDGSFFGASTHGHPELEFRTGFPNFKPLPVSTQKLPGQASKIDQYY